jgi:hypothetical protein
MREYIDPDRGDRRDHCFAGLPVAEMRQLGPSLIERRNNRAALWRPGRPQHAQADKGRATLTARTTHFSAMPFVLCSAAKVHPRDSQASRASSAACRSEVGPDRSRQRGSWTLAMSAVHIQAGQSAIRPGCARLRTFCGAPTDLLGIRSHTVCRLPIRSDAIPRKSRPIHPQAAPHWWTHYFLVLNRSSRAPARFRRTARSRLIV